MPRILRLVGAGTLLLWVTACSRDRTGEHTTRGVDTVSVRQEWFPNANYAGAVLASAQFAQDHHLLLTVQPGSENLDPVTQVVARRDQFGEAGADRVIAAIDKGAPIQVIAVIHPISPTVFLSKAALGITTPAHFKGRRIGVLTGTATEYVYRALLRKAGLGPNDVTEVEAGFDLQGFLGNVYDVRPAFAYDEPVSLARQNVPVVLIRPAEYGVRFVGTVYFARSDFIKAHPEVVQSFVSSIIDGWRLAIERPELAVGRLRSRYPDLDSLRELESLKRATEYMQPSGDSVPPFRATLSDWEATLEHLNALGVGRNVRLSDAVDDRFVNAYYANPRIQ